MKNKKQLTPIELCVSDDILNLLTKAKRFEVIAKMSYKMTKLKETEKHLFKMAGEESDE